MAVDRSKIEALIDKQIRAIEKTHQDSWEIGEIACIIEVVREDAPMEIRMRHSGSPVVAVGLLGLARDAIQAAKAGSVDAEGKKMPRS